MTTDPVVLVQMPYGALATPSIGLGLLKAILEREGIPTQALYPNLEFADQIGHANYEAIGREAARLVGEWTFAGAAFPDFKPNHDLYLDRLGQIFTPNDPVAISNMTADLWSVRRAADAFVKRVAQEIVATKPRIVGCTSVFQQHCAALALLRQVRELDPSIITMIGGANCESIMGSTTLREFFWIDIVVSGEADGLIVSLCKLLLAEGADVSPERLPEGVFSQRGRTQKMKPNVFKVLDVLPAKDSATSQAKVKTPRAIFDKLDTNPIPDYDDYFTALARTRITAAITPGLPIETSRGCWWGEIQHCTFCGLNGGAMKFRSKSPQRVVQEFTALAQRYGIRRFAVVDNILDKSYFPKMLPQLAELPQKLTFFQEVKANLSRDQLRLLAEAGGTWLQPGLESLNDQALRAMKKGTTAAINIQLLKWARELGIFVFWTILHGLPDEQPEWYEQMRALVPKLEHLQAPTQVGPIAFQRFSPYHTRAGEFGLKLVPSWPHFWIYPVNQQAMEDLSYWFDDVSQTGLEPGEIPNGELLGTMPDAGAEVRALRSECTQWRRRFYSTLPPILSMTDIGDALRIIDTRECAAARVTDLTGLEHRVYLLCDQASSVSSIRRRMKMEDGQHFDEEQLRATLEDLSERNLLLKLGDRYLALAVAGDIPTLHVGAAYPAGYVDRAFVLPKQTMFTDESSPLCNV
jgi:ribosomal peptide maturation radical SAM protein 1